MPWMLFETPIGQCGVAWNDAGLTLVQLPEGSDDATRARLLAKASDPGAMETASSAPGWVKNAVARIQKHLAGSIQDLTQIPLDTSLVSPFYAKALRAAQGISAGRTATYGDLAGIAGSPGASRAVGRAMATNRWPIVVPCHRVKAAGRGAGGFSAYGGLVTKERLLQIEGGTLLVGLDTKSPKQLPLTASTKRGFPFDPAVAVRALAVTDRVLAKHMDRVGPFGLQLKETDETFFALAEAIVYQQLSGRAAATIFGRVCATFPNGTLDPKRLLRMSDATLREAGLSAAKLASLRDLAARTVEGSIPSIRELHDMDDEAIVSRLTEVRGIGRWTVEMLLMFRLGRPDVLPVSDYGVRKGFARIFRNGRTKYAEDELPTPAAIVTRAERWRPFRSVATWYLWRALDL